MEPEFDLVMEKFINSMFLGFQPIQVNLSWLKVMENRLVVTFVQIRSWMH